MNDSLALSPLGHARKRETLSAMRRVAAGRRRRRRAIIAAAAGAPILALAAALSLRPVAPAPGAGQSLAHAPAPAPAPSAPPSRPVSAAWAMAHARFEIAAPSAVNRVAIAPGDLTLPVEILDDDSLSAALRSVGRDPGVVRTGRGVRVLAASHAAP